VITAVGMVDHLAVMMAAVIIAITLMVMASKALTRFVNSHPTIVILCLSFLLMIGFSLVADGFGFHIPKGYLYAAIGFSVMIEALNQLAIFQPPSLPVRQSDPAPAHCRHGHAPAERQERGCGAGCRILRHAGRSQRRADL
jgi:predicted tellurium resistance membrane protein TerC